MKHVSKSSQKGLLYMHAFESARQNKTTSLHDIYTTCSSAKKRAFYLCEKIRKEENSTSLGYIISHNCNFFSYAFETSKGLRILTAYNSFIIY